MYVNKKMIANGYTGYGHSTDEVAEYRDGHHSGLRVTRGGAGIDLLWVDKLNDVRYNGELIVEHTSDGVIVRCGNLELTIPNDEISTSEAE
ncbi:hypothetical protein N9Q27_00275 [bacterium]|nr:hypothetical protein [bacterium]